MKIKSIFLLLTFVAASPVFSDTVTFRDGTVLQGRLKGQNMNSITFFADGKEQIFQKKNIRRVSYGETSEEKKKFEELKRKSEQLKSSTVSVDEKSRQLALLQKEIENLFKQQEERRKVAEQLDEEFQAVLKKEISGPNALLRQAAFPGWGHRYRGENIKAISWASGFTVVLMYAASLNSTAAKNESDYKSSVLTTAVLSSQLTAGSPLYMTALYHLTLVEGKYSNFSASVKRYNQSLSVVSAVYLASLLHLAWDNWFKAMFTNGGASEENKGSSEDGPKVNFYYMENRFSPENKGERDMGFVISLRF